MKTKRTKQGHVCDCQQPAVVKKASGYVCARCLELERRYYGLDSIGRRKNAMAGGAAR